MAIADMPEPETLGEMVHKAAKSDVMFERLVLKSIEALASLKVTVALMAMGVFLVFAGTLAQREQGIWEVVDTYFRSFYVWINFQVFDFFFPSHVVIPGGIPFFGGLSIGVAMCINLFSAHLLRFKIQARGQRLVAGLAVILLGVIVTLFVIAGGSNKNGMLELPWISWSALWLSLEATALLGCIGGTLAVILALRQAEPHQWSRQVVLLMLQGLIVIIGLVLLFLIARGFYPGDAAMRIVWQLSKGAAAGLVLLAGCALVFRKRAGVVLLHAGVGLMLLNEVVVGTLHIETQMSIPEGATVNWAHDIRATELAIIDSSNPKEDSVVALPMSLLRWNEGSVVSDPELPFDVKLDKYYSNSLVRPRKDGEPALATAGLNQDLVVDERRAGAGADQNSDVDFPAALLTLYRKGTKDSLGTFLLGVELTLRDLPETVAAGAKNYNLALRFQRFYKPYTVHLNDVVRENYPGTDKPKAYESYVRMVDPSRNFDRNNIKIWMNNPLRFGDETFYQSGHHVDASTGQESTTLSVVRNTGWMIPYVACAIVAIGMGAHFLITLTRFLGRQLETEVPAAKPKRAPNRKNATPAVPAATGFGAWSTSAGGTLWSDFIARPASWYVPIFAALLLTMYYGSKARMPAPVTDESIKALAPDKDGKPAKVPFDFAAFGRLPVQDEGRIKPMDSLARNILHQISDTEKYYETDPNTDKPKTLSQKLFAPRAKSHSAVQWLLETVAGADGGDELRVFRIQNLEVLDVLGLKPREGYRFSLSDIRPRIKEFDEQVELTSKVDPKLRDTAQHKLMETQRKFSLFVKLRAAFHPPEAPEFPNAQELREQPDAARQMALTALKQTQMIVERLKAIEPPMATPVYDSKEEIWRWVPYASAKLQDDVNRLAMETFPITLPRDEATDKLSKIFDYYEKGNASAFNRAVAEYSAFVHDKLPESAHLKTVDVEAFYNTFDPLNLAWYGYLFSFFVLVLSWMGWRRPLNRTAFAMLLMTCSLHFVAICMRVYISGRPPVTNLYSAAVFIGWGSVVVGLVLEAIFRIGIGNLVAAFGGGACLQIAYSLSGSGDTFTVLQAVLDTQFWLATHVLCISTGYLTTYVAGALAICLLVWGSIVGVYRWFNAGATPAGHHVVVRTIDRMTYGVLCFAIFFSFVGTVLGGLWADDSWGRFWGWDPKENGALIIVLWNALVLHARWDRLVGPRGTAVLCVAGNMVVSWSFFGVNELGAGLHSYGFTEGVLLALGLFCASQAAIMALGMSLPASLWRSSPRPEAVEAKLVD